MTDDSTLPSLGLDVSFNQYPLFLDSIPTVFHIRLLREWSIINIIMIIIITSSGTSGVKRVPEPSSSLSGERFSLPSKG